jgi:hypothetical protein
MRWTDAPGNDAIRLPRPFEYEAKEYIQPLRLVEKIYESAHTVKGRN